MTGHIIRQKIITRVEVRANPDRIYVFGDNIARAGFGGQAAQMRGEINAVGVPTKWRPSTDESAYFTDRSLENPAVLCAIDEAFTRLRHAIDSGYDVVIPADGLGTGLAQLEERAPAVLAYIEAKIKALENLVK